MFKFAYYLSSRKRRTTQEGSHRSKKQKPYVPMRDDDAAALSVASSSANKSCKRSSQKVSSKEQRSFTPTAMGPHFSLRPHTGAKGSHDGMMQKSNRNEEAPSAIKPHEEERSHTEANKKYGGMSRLEYLMKRNCCRKCGPWKQRDPVQMGCYSPGTEPDHIPYHLYTLIKEVVDILARYERSQITDDLRDLQTVERKIKFFYIYFNCHLPRGWKYKRDNASSLIAGYDTLFAKDGPRYDLSGYTPFRDKLKSSYTAEIMSIVHSRKTPTPETFMEWSWPEMVFYSKLCSCFGIDYQHLETASEDDVCLMNMGS